MIRQLGHGGVIDGQVRYGLRSLVDAFAANFDELDEVGPPLDPYLHERRVVHLWGGFADRAAGRPWTRDDASRHLLLHQGCLAVACLCLVQDGRLDLDRTGGALLARIRRACKGDASPCGRC